MSIPATRDPAGMTLITSRPAGRATRPDIDTSTSSNRRVSRFGLARVDEVFVQPHFDIRVIAAAKRSKRIANATAVVAPKKGVATPQEIQASAYRIAAASGSRRAGASMRSRIRVVRIALRSGVRIEQVPARVICIDEFGSTSRGRTIASGNSARSKHDRADHLNVRNSCMHEGQGGGRADTATSTVPFAGCAP